jgi:hypothetical protein
MSLMLSRVAAITILTTLLSACDLFGEAKVESNWTVEDAKGFKDYPLYWLGENYQGLPLTVVQYGKGTALETVGFVYGESSCRGQSECSAPIWIRIHPYCQDSPVDVRRFLPALEDVGYQTSHIEIRGNDAIWVDIPRVYLWTGSSAISINGEADESGESLVKQAAQDLIPISEDVVGNLEPLPAPAMLAC